MFESLHCAFLSQWLDLILAIYCFEFSFSLFRDYFLIFFFIMIFLKVLIFLVFLVYLSILGEDSSELKELPNIPTLFKVFMGLLLNNLEVQIVNISVQ
mmetsp:Transcript_28971/g.43729  ORF Transcript_28971/g.43729 Transcript_28971/m.43729 type:complete len:98 (+) Transcript_28971:217-510(+)